MGDNWEQTQSCAGSFAVILYLLSTWIITHKERHLTNRPPLPPPFGLSWITEVKSLSATTVNVPTTCQKKKNR